MRLMQVAQGAAAVELWVELWVAGAPGALQRDLTLGDAAGADDPQASQCLGCEGIKAKGLLFQGPTSETPARVGALLISYCTEIKLF